MSATILKLMLLQHATADDGRTPIVVPWSATAGELPLTSALLLAGVAKTDSLYGENVDATLRGIVRDCTPPASETWAVGDLLWGTLGGYATKVRPAAPFPQVLIGEVAHAVGGGVFDVAVNVRVFPSPLDLSGVALSAPADKQVLIYKASTSLFELRKLDHGGDLDGLGDDDHPQYLKEKASGGTAGEVPEHTHDSAATGGLTNSRRWSAMMGGF
jgi:hypothetical protein